MNPAPTKLLILGDSPDLGTGLSRIGHDLAQILSAMPEFEVGYLGRGGQSHRRYPWMQYNFPVSAQWGEEWLRSTWEDFAGTERGILLTVWDASRLIWLANPAGLPDAQWLANPPFDLWGYFMQDAEGIQPGALPLIHATVMSRFKRVLLASKWAWGLAKQSLPAHPDVDWMPHGINTKVFKPSDLTLESKQQARYLMFQKPVSKVWGCCMTNQSRKHWPTVLEALKLSPGVHLWAHTDQLIAYWNLPALALEYGVLDRVFFDVLQRSDEQMSFMYGLCDLTLLISGGEGFGYPIAESLACGVPVVTGGYGAGAELNTYHDNVVDYKLICETQHNVLRAHHHAYAIDRTIKNVQPESIASVDHLSWDNLQHPWMKWFRKGVSK